MDRNVNKMRMMIVAKDGSGDFTRIQEAVDAVPEGTGEPVRILVQAGEYREKVVIHRDGIRLCEGSVCRRDREGNLPFLHADDDRPGYYRREPDHPE